ncbi:MAG TPA: 2-oxoglutarate dehydrogenase E1 component [Bacteroidia bacterium]|nr:2-oxoglutarate dehydrogenase E1 component [Bacteroidia bacterium]
MDKFSFLSNADVSAIEELYLKYLSNPNEVDPSWHDFFKGFDFARTNYSELPTESSQIPENISKEFKVITLINAYRSRGHLFTKTNPVRQRRVYTPNLDIENFGLSQQDLDTVFHAGNEIGIGPAPLRKIIEHLQQTYCNSIGVEYAYLRDPNVFKWIQERLEKTKSTPNYTQEEKKEILKKLIQAVNFEQFLHTKFVGQKRFSLEGNEGFIPALHNIIQTGANLGVKDFVLGMAHRGRLNVLANIMQKGYSDIFTEFEGRPSEDPSYDGDVKYHMGFSSDFTDKNNNKIHISLVPNPSHLEAVNAVVEGIARAKMDNLHKGDLNKICPILVHGDASIAGQGVVYEVVQMSQLDGYKVGGTIHIVINNQIGFTTNYTDGRSSIYCTDVAKVVLAPVFHVNADDIEALCFVAQLAIEFRQTFHRDIFIDILGYRKYGHNEGDEPRFTQPVLYKIIAQHPNVKQIYLKKLEAERNTELLEFAKQYEIEFKKELESKLEESKKANATKMTSFLQGYWNNLRMATDKDFETSPDTTKVDKETFLSIAKKINTLPKDLKFFNKTIKLFEERLKMIETDSYDWAMGELMAYATLMNEGHNVRFSGQDVERGTFSHRHAVLKIEDSEEEYTPLNNAGLKGELRIYNSLLSEYAVLGFEYGYAYAAPHDLVIWEAQFGDFANGAQIVFDQYISSAEYKWRRMNGLVVLLPHGYEGQGPEHSSARIERYLQLCAGNNMQVVNTTTPAQQFHVLRRQLKRDFRKPLICFTPKKLLRYPLAVSKLSDFTNDKFHEVLDDTFLSVSPSKVKYVGICSGKIYYDLIEFREKNNIEDIAFIRLEQLYPFPKKQLLDLISKYSSAKEFYFIQEETENAGAWQFVFYQLKDDISLKYIGRPASASPATGFSKKHEEETKTLLSKVFEKSLSKTIKQI